MFLRDIPQGMDPVKTPRCIGFDLVREGTLGFRTVSTSRSPSALVLDAAGRVWFTTLPEPGLAQGLLLEPVPPGIEPAPLSPVSPGGASFASLEGAGTDATFLGRWKGGAYCGGREGLDASQSATGRGEDPLEHATAVLDDFTNLWMLGTSRPSGLRPFPQGGGHESCRPQQQLFKTFFSTLFLSWPLAVSRSTCEDLMVQG